MNCPKAVFFAFLVVMLISASSFAIPVPAHGDYDTIVDPLTAKTVIFNPAAPWIPTTNVQTAGFVVYATEDHTDGGYSGATSDTRNEYSITDIPLRLLFPDQIDYGQVSGYLAIRYINSTIGDITFSETVATINFAGDPMQVYLPGFTLSNSEDMHLWVASDGSTYYANVTDGKGSSGAPNISAEKSIEDGRVAATPEPATLLLLGLGSVLLRRKK